MKEIFIQYNSAEGVQFMEVNLLLLTEHVADLLSEQSSSLSTYLMENMHKLWESELISLEKELWSWTRCDMFIFPDAETESQSKPSADSYFWLSHK